jgi:hypothetical protein
MSDYTPTTEEALYCSQCWADLKLYPPATELVFERDFTVNTETVRKVYRYVRTDATEFDRWLAEVKAQAWQEGFNRGVQFFNAGDERNPYRIIISANDYDQLRKALEQE